MRYFPATPADPRQDNDKVLSGALERGGASSFVQGIGGLDRLLSACNVRRPINTAGRFTYTTRPPTYTEGDTTATTSAVNSGTATPTDGQAAASGAIAVRASGGDAVAAAAVVKTDGPAASETCDDANKKNRGSDPASLVDDIPALLSGGQWQRIALSRAFLRHGETDLIVLDEPSASLGAF